MDGAAATAKTNVAEAPRKRLTATSETAANEVERKVKSDARKPRTNQRSQRKKRVRKYNA